MSRHNLREVYIEALIDLAKDNANIVSLDTDSREATLADKFAAIYPERSFHLVLLNRIWWAQLLVCRLWV